MNSCQMSTCAQLRRNFAAAMGLSAGTARAELTATALRETALSMHQITRRPAKSGSKSSNTQGEHGSFAERSGISSRRALRRG